MPLIDFVFPKLRSLKTWLYKCLRSNVSEHLLKSNMVNEAKHCWNKHQITFIILIDNFRGNWVGKNFSYWHAKCCDCLLTHWLPMTSIPFLIGKILRYQCGWYYLRNKKIFSELFSAFLKSISNVEHFEKKGDCHRFCISKITKFENVFR